MIRSRTLTACLLVAGLSLMACGGGSKDGDDGEGTPAGSSGASGCEGASCQQQEKEPLPPVPAPEKKATECFPPQVRAEGAQCAPTTPEGSQCSVSMTAADTVICTVQCTPGIVNCPGGFVCTSGVCREPCDSLSDCSPGYRSCDAAGASASLKLCN